VIEGGEQIDVGVLNVQAPRTQAHFDLAALDAAAGAAVGMREADGHASDSIPESSEGESQPTLDVDAQDVSDIDIAFWNPNRHHPALPSAA
jgi:hypothetical protein